MLLRVYLLSRTYLGLHTLLWNLYWCQLQSRKNPLISTVAGLRLSTGCRILLWYGLEPSRIDRKVR